MIDLTPKQFEGYVEKWFRAAGKGLKNFKVTRLEKITGAGGEYEIDVVARMTVFRGAELEILVECKKHRNRIKREVIMALESKLRDTKAHKGMVFSTSGFQSGALQFAATHKIATVLVTGEEMHYRTRALLEPKPSGRAVGWLVNAERGMSVITESDPKYLRAWLSS